MKRRLEFLTPEVFFSISLFSRSSLFPFRTEASTGFDSMIEFQPSESSGNPTAPTNSSLTERRATRCVWCLMSAPSGKTQCSKLGVVRGSTGTGTYTGTYKYGWLEETGVWKIFLREVKHTDVLPYMICHQLPTYIDRLSHQGISRVNCVSYGCK